MSECKHELIIGRSDAGLPFATCRCQVAKLDESVLHTRGYAGLGPDDGQDRGAYCIECSAIAEDYVWPCALTIPR